MSTELSVINYHVILTTSVAYHTCFIWTQAYVSLRKIYINLENHLEYPHNPYIARI